MALVTLDFETAFSSGKVNPEKFSLAGDTTYEEYISDPRFWPYGVGIGFDLDEPIWYDFKTTDLTELLSDIFHPGNDHSMVAHNNMFDGAVLAWYYGLYPARYYCTVMMSKGLWRFESASLANLAKRLWPMNDDRRKGKELAVADGLINPDEFTREILDYVGGYCEQDCRLTTLAFIDMMNEFPETELDVIDDTVRMFVERPLKLNQPLVLEYQKTLNAEREEAFRKSGYPRDVLASPDKFVKMLREDHDIEIKKVPSPTLKNPKNKKWPLAKNDVSFIKLRQSRPDLDHLWEGRIAAASNQEPTRCERFLTHGAVGDWNPEGRIAIPLNYCGANTTRFSGTNSINMQNLGRKSKLRDALTAKDGHMLIISDLSGIENRFNADHAQALWKLKAFADKRDLYNELATDVFGYLVDRKAKDDNDNKLFAGEGALGKTAELGLGYGMGVPKFVLTCHQGPMGEPPMLWVDEELGHRTVSTWRGKNTEIVNSWHMADNFLEIMAQPMEKPIQWGSVEMCYQGIRLPSGLFIQYPRLRYDKSVFKNDDGSDRWTWQYWVNVGRNGFWKDIWGGTVIENIIQGISRVKLTDVQRAVKRRFAKAGIDGLVVLQVHDELVFSAVKSAIEDALGIVEEEMRRRPSWASEYLVLDCESEVSSHYVKP